MKDGFGSPYTTDTSDTASSGDPELTTAAKAGIALGVIGGIILGVLAVLGISYWKRQQKSKSRDKTSDPVERMEEGGAPAVQVLEHRPGKCEFMHFATSKRSDGPFSHDWGCISVRGGPWRCSEAARGIQEGSKTERGYVPSS